MLCDLCPRACGKDRSSSFGFCASSDTMNICRAAPHLWEEPCVSGKNGSGAVFFSGCNMRCIFCQNENISRDGTCGENISPKRLAEIFLELKGLGVHNINLVTPTHFADKISEALDICSPLPVVYNTNAYENPEIIKRLGKKVDIWLPDFKYSDAELAVKFSKAPDYPKIALRAILQMYRQVGRYVIGDDGLMKQGVIIRHLILPGHIENTKGVIDTISDNFPRDSILFSLMSQYTPPEKEIAEFPELNRKISEDEYAEAYEYMISKGIYDGYAQELDSSIREYTPDFDMTGVVPQNK